MLICSWYSLYIIDMTLCNTFNVVFSGIPAEVYTTIIKHLTIILCASTNHNISIIIESMELTTSMLAFTKKFRGSTINSIVITQKNGHNVRSILVLDIIYGL